MQLRSNASGAVKVIIAEKDRKRATNGGSNARGEEEVPMHAVLCDMLSIVQTLDAIQTY